MSEITSYKQAFSQEILDNGIKLIVSRPDQADAPACVSGQK